MNKISYESFVSNYKLTVDEVLLLPENLRLAYLDRIYKDICEEAKTKGKYTFIKISDEFNDYFEKKGFKAETSKLMDNVTEITKVSDTDYAPTDEEYELVEKYITLIADARWILYDAAVRKALEEALKGLNSKESIIDQDFSLSKYSYILRADIDSESYLTDDIAKLVDLELDIIIQLLSEYELAISKELSGIYKLHIAKKGYNFIPCGKNLSLIKTETTSE